MSNSYIANNANKFKFKEKKKDLGLNPSAVKSVFFSTERFQNSLKKLNQINVFFTAFYPITQSFNSISHLMWKCEGRKKSPAKAGIR